MNMATLMMTTVGTGVSLAGLMIGLVAWLRADTRRMEDRWQTDMKVLREDMRQMEDRLQEEITAVRKDINALRERTAHLEGLLDGLREAIVARAVA